MPVFNSYKCDLLTGAVSLSADAALGLIKVILVSASWTPDIDVHTRYRDVSAHEVSVTGPIATAYVAGGQAVSASQTFTVDTTDDEGVWDSGADITWASSTITARYLVLVKVRSAGLSKENDNLIGYIDFGSNQSSSNGNFTIQWAAEGILNVN